MSEEYQSVYERYPFPITPQVYRYKTLDRAREVAWIKAGSIENLQKRSKRYNYMLYRYCRRYKFWHHTTWADYYAHKVRIITLRELMRDG